MFEHNRLIEVHGGFHLLLADMNKRGTQDLFRIANSLFGEKSYDFLSVSHI